LLSMWEQSLVAANQMLRRLDFRLLATTKLSFELGSLGIHFNGIGLYQLGCNLVALDAFFVGDVRKALRNRSVQCIVAFLFGQPFRRSVVVEEVRQTYGGIGTAAVRILHDPHPTGLAAVNSTFRRIERHGVRQAALPRDGRQGGNR
jgi:hypothetical protein